MHTPKGWDDLPAYLEQTGLDYPIAHDPSGATIQAYEVNSYPDYYVIDRAGNLRFADLANAELDRAVKYLLAEKPDLTEALRARVAAQPALRFEVVEDGNTLITIDMTYALDEVEGELVLKHSMSQEGLRSQAQEVLASPRDLSLREISGMEADDAYSYRVMEGRLIGRRGRGSEEIGVDMEFPANASTQGMALLRGTLLPHEEGARAAYTTLDTAGDPQLQKPAVVRYTGKVLRAVDGEEQALHVVEIVEDGEVEARLLLDDQHRLVGVELTQEGAPEIRVSTPGD